MGGNVFPEGTTRRFESEEYFALSSEVIEKFSTLHQVVRIEIIPAYREKESFGDCDILFSTFCGSTPVSPKEFSELFSTENVSKNSEVTSIEYKKLQVDFISIPQEHFDYAFKYFYSDFGNLVSKLFRYFGIKHGHMGLELVLRDGSNKFDEVLLTLDHDKALRFVGLDPDIFNAGFDNLEQMFDYISSSPYYSPEWYKLENISSIGRVRDKKRPTYRKFLEYGEKYTGNRATKVEDKSVFLEKIFEYFPEAYHRYKKAVDKLTVQKAVKEKFNGGHVTVLTGLQGKELGEFMQVLKRDWYFKPENILYLTREQIDNKILICFINFKG